MIRTVLGDVDEQALGVTFAHEHLLMTGGWAVMNEPDYRLASVDDAIAEVGPAMAAGLSALVEMSPLGFGRSARGLAAISRATGLHIIAATGLHKVTYYADNHWRHRYSADQIARLLIQEVEIGMDENNLEGPLPDTTEARAGVIKFATLYQSFGRSMDSFAEAVGQAHLATGAPVATHCDHGTMGIETLELLQRNGVSPRHVILGHIDANPDAGYLSELAARGAFLEFDRPGRVRYAPDSNSLALIETLVDAGYGDQLLLGSDLARRSYWRSLGGGPGLDYLLTRFVPRLRERGLGEMADRFLVDNIARALSFATVAVA